MMGRVRRNPGIHYASAAPEPEPGPEPTKHEAPNPERWLAVMGLQALVWFLVHQVIS